MVHSVLGILIKDMPHKVFDVYAVHTDPQLEKYTFFMCSKFSSPPRAEKVYLESHIISRGGISLIAGIINLT